MVDRPLRVGAACLHSTLHPVDSPSCPIHPSPDPKTLTLLNSAPLQAAHVSQQSCWALLHGHKGEQVCTLLPVQMTMQQHTAGLPAGATSPSLTHTTRCGFEHTALNPLSTPSLPPHLQRC